jgi:hypothetical protein
MDGWIKLHRQFINWEWYDLSEMVHLFVHLLLKANHKDGEWRGIKLNRGQLITGLNQLNKETKISIQTIRSCLKKLEKTGEINRETNNRFSLITICNYDSYNNEEQPTNKQGNNQPTSNQQATNKQPTTNKNDKNDKNDKNAKNSNRAKKTTKFTPPSLDEVKKYFSEKGYKEASAIKFFDYYETGNWEDSKGNQVKNWKQKALAVWFKDENKIPDKSSQDQKFSFVDTGFVS